MQIVLETDRLRLRRFTADDIDLLVDLDSDPEVKWGKGYASEGSRALVNRAFRELGAQRVRAETMTVNTASRHVRAFYLEWPEEIEGTAEGDVEYAITRADWEP
jgi:RimJ/RimL family protein N-acetyltransferase